MISIERAPRWGSVRASIESNHAVRVVVPQIPRRSFLRLGGAAATAALFPACIRDAMDIPAFSEKQSLEDVHHVVILLQENRAFDHYFGTMRGVRGFGDRFTVPVAGAPTIFHEKDGNDEFILPYHLDSTAGNAQRVLGTPHGFLDGGMAYNHGRYGTWPTIKAKQSMGYYTEQELGFQFALAEAFTICDAYFCGMHSSTNPNRLVAFTGTIDPAGTKGGPATDNTNDHLADPAFGYTWTTYAERLEEAGVSWKVYQDMADNFSDNPLAGFATFRSAYDNDPGSPLVQKGLSSTLTTPNLDGLRADVVAGTLPSVSWIVGPADYSEHPGPSSPVQGAWYVQQVLEALIANPEVWSKTVFLVTFDENDGFFDHLPPPCAPSRGADGLVAGGSTVDDTGETIPESISIIGGGPYGPGVRVPMWVVSPFSRGGWVNSETFDHTSILRFLEERFGVREPNISPFRRAMCGNLRSAFNFESPNDDALPALPSRTKTDADKIRADQQALAPVPVPIGSSGTMPVQATGTRPSRAIPYELHVETVVGLASVRFTFVNTGGVGAVFHVYDRTNLVEIPRRFAVEAGKSLTRDLPLLTPGGEYDFFVLGPNGYHRTIAGVASSDSVDRGLEIDVVYDRDAERMRIRVVNGTSSAQSVSIVDRAYGLTTPIALELATGARSDQWFDLAASGRWYDFEITAATAPAFRRRIAGRVENEQHSVSDPAMGMTI